MGMRIISVLKIGFFVCFLSCDSGFNFEFKNISGEAIQIQYEISNAFFLEGVKKEQSIDKELDDSEQFNINFNWTVFNSSIKTWEGYREIANYEPIFKDFSITYLESDKKITLKDDQYFVVSNKKGKPFFTIYVLPYAKKKRCD